MREWLCPLVEIDGDTDGSFVCSLWRDSLEPGEGTDDLALSELVLLRGKFFERMLPSNGETSIGRPSSNLCFFLGCSSYCEGAGDEEFCSRS